MTGILQVMNGESRINGVLLARSGSGDPFGNATSFLSDNDCNDGDCVTVTGTQGTNGFFIDSAVKEDPSACTGALAAAQPEPTADLERLAPTMALARRASPGVNRAGKRPKKAAAVKGGKKSKKPTSKKPARKPRKSSSGPGEKASRKRPAKRPRRG